MTVRRFSARAIAGFAGLLLIIVALVAMTILALRSTTTRERAAIQEYSEALRLADRLRFEGERMVAAARGYLLSGDPVRLSKMQAAREEFWRLSRVLEEAAVTPEERMDIRRLEEDMRAYEAALEEAFRQPLPPNTTSGVVQVFENTVQPRREQLDASLAEFVSRGEQQFALGLQQASQMTTRAVVALAGVGAVGLLLSLWLAWGSTRRLTSLYRATEDARERTQRAMMARNEMLGIIAHDLRSPVSAILMKAGLIRKTSASGEAGDRLRRQAQSIENTALRMEHLIKSLLDASTIEEGQLKVSPERCDVGELLDTIFDLFEPLAGLKSIRLERQLPRRDIAVAADRERVLQVLSNLVDNAIKFTPEGGIITLRSERVGDQVRFAVADTGPGITEEQRSRLFERYWQKDRKEGRRGAGLGLYIAKGIIDAHQGSLWVESELARGSTFFFTLPLAPPERYSQEEPRLPPPAAGPPP